MIQMINSLYFDKVIKLFNVTKFTNQFCKFWNLQELTYRDQFINFEIL